MPFKNKLNKCHCHILYDNSVHYEDIFCVLYLWLFSWMWSAMKIENTLGRRQICRLKFKLETKFWHMLRKKSNIYSPLFLQKLNAHSASSSSPSPTPPHNKPIRSIEGEWLAAQNYSASFLFKANLQGSNPCQMISKLTRTFISSYWWWPALFIWDFAV